MFSILSLTLSAAALLGDATAAVEYYPPTVSCPSSPPEDCATEEANDATDGSVYTEPPLRFLFGTMAPEERERRRLAMPKVSSAHRVLRIEDDDSGDNEYDSDDDDDESDESDKYKDEKRLFLDDDPKFKDLYDSMTDHAARDELYNDVKEESELASMLDPRARHTWSHEQLHAYFGCERSFALTRPLYDDGMWTELRRLWRDFAEEEDRGDGPPPPNGGGEPERGTHRFGAGSFEPPMEPFQTGERGRGLRATRDIARGELVFEATNNTIVFTRGHTFRLFLFHIHTRRDEDSLLDSGTTCDALVWPWIQTLEENGDPVILFDLDNGSLLNAGRDEDGWDPPNIRCGKEGDSMCMMEYYATKDIKPGDEILCDYSDFAMFDFWEMGL